MNIRNRNLLTLALATALAAPLAAAAQTETTQAELDAQQQVAEEQGAAQTTEALPPQANPAEEAQQEVDPRVPVGEDPMNAIPPPAPMQAQDAPWGELDTNGDGRIDTSEAAMDAGFNSSFEAMDADGDGFVTDAEFRDHSMTSPPRDDGSMEHQDMRDDGMGDDGMRDDGMDDSTLDDGSTDGIDDPVDG